MTERPNTDYLETVAKLDGERMASVIACGHADSYAKAFEYLYAKERPEERHVKALLEVIDRLPGIRPLERQLQRELAQHGEFTATPGLSLPPPLIEVRSTFFDHDQIIRESIIAERTSTGRRELILIEPALCAPHRRARPYSAVYEFVEGEPGSEAVVGQVWAQDYELEAKTRLLMAITPRW